MFHVRVMSVEDYGFAVGLANTMGWGMGVSDFGFSRFLEPEGCFVLLDDCVPVGVATCVSFGGVGWFGSLVVRSEFRGCGGGRLLLDCAVKYLRGRGVGVVGLYAYPYLVDFYGRLGFKADMGLAVMYCEKLPLFDFGLFDFGVRPDFSVLVQFDCAFFGANRSRLLRGILEGGDNLCYVVRDVGGGVVGYVLAKVCGDVVEVGPLVCSSNRSEVVFELLKAVFSKCVGRSVWLYLSEEQLGVVEFLLGLGFRKVFSLSRMFLGEPKIQSGVYLAESLERG